MTAEYQKALAQARADLAAAQTRLAVATAELSDCEANIRKLRGLIYALSNLVGEPLPDGFDQKAPRRTRA